MVAKAASTLTPRMELLLTSTNASSDGYSDSDNVNAAFARPSTARAP